MLDFTVDNVKKVVDKSCRSYINEKFIELVNKATENSEIANEIKHNIISYTSVLTEGKYKMTTYIDAVKFVSYKLLGKSSLQAYMLTFPERYEKLITEGVDDVSPYASMYAKNKIVVAIMTQTLVPSHVLNQHMFQDALNSAYEIMVDERQKGLVRVKAIEAILNYTKQPEKTQISLDINRSNDVVSDMKVALTEMARLQRDSIISSGLSVTEAIEADVIDVNYAEVE